MTGNRPNHGAGQAERDVAASLRLRLPIDGWACDVCDAAITDAGNGAVRWSTGRAVAERLQLVHASRACLGSPEQWASLPIRSFLASGGLVESLGLVFPHSVADGDAREVDINLLESWAEVVRRLTLPWYEPARNAWLNHWEE